MRAVKDELDRTQRLGVIEPVETPTEWCAGMVVVPKTNGWVRICVYLTKLNEDVYHERHPLPAVDQTLAQIAGARVFSKLDANSGFWQIPLSKELALLTTFITPFRRYYFNRLPFGITSAPEHFQRRMSALLRDLEGVICLIDNILIYGNTQDTACLALSRKQERKINNERDVGMACQEVHKQGKIKVMVTTQSPLPTSLLTFERCRDR